WTNSTFLATTTHPNMQYAGNLTYTLTDSNSTVFGPNPIPVADSTVSNDSIYITLDFLFDEADDFVRGDQLIIQYDLSFDPPNIGPDSTLTYPTTSTLSINGNNAGCGGGGNGDYVQTVNFVQSNPGITLALSQAAAVFDTFDVDIDLNITNYTADSVFVTLIHPDYVFVDTNSVSGFGNIKPTIITLGDSTRFSFAGSSLPVGTGTIQAKIYNDCTPTTSINARVDYNCTDPAFATDNLSFTIPTPNITITPNFSRNIVADCDTISVDIDLVGVSGSNWNADTVEVVIETTNYLYNSVTSITGFGGVLPSDTTAYADSLVFRFLNTPNTSATGTIRLLLTKICGTPKLLNVALHERDACGTVYGSVTNSDEPLLNTVADVSVIFTPNDVTVENINPSWIIYVTNSGSGTAFNTALYDSIGQHLRLDSVYVNGSRQDSLITFNYQVNKTTFDIDLGDLAPGQTDTITVFTRLKGTDCDLADQTSSTTTWYKNCPGSCATPIVKDGVPRFTVPNSNLRARNVVPDSVELCSTDTLAIYLINNGATTDYNIEAEYDFLQTGFEYQTGTTKVQLNSGARTATNDPAGFTAGDTLLLWTKTEIPELASLDVGDTLKIFFEVRTTCDFSANRRTSTVARYSTPCQVDTSGTSTATEISLSNSITIEIKEPIITLNKDVAKDTTGSWSNTIYASYNEPVYYRIQIYNNGNATAQNALIRDSIPSNLQYQTIVPQGSAPAISSVNIVNGAYEFTLASDLPLGLSEYYIYTVVDSCVDPVTNLAYVYWGCNASSCRDLFTSVTSGTVVTQPSVAGATSVVSSADFSTCGGEMRIIVDNDTTGGMPSSVARNVVVTDTLPTGYVYDQGTATITSTYISTGLPTGRTFADTEPDTSAGGTIIQWATEVDTIIPGERITITFRVEGDGTYCDSDLNSDPGIVPTSDNVVDLDYTNTCGDPIVSPPATTTVNPLTPNVNIDITPTLQTAGLGQRVTFTVTLTNVGDGAADSLYLNIELGNGFSSIVQESGQGGGVDSLGVATIIGDSVLYWDYTDIDTIEAAGGNDTKSAVFSAIVGPDSLNVLGVVEGWCVDGAGTRICRHSYDTTPAIVTVAGVEFNKVHWSTVQPGAVTSDSTAYGTIGNPIFHRDSLNLFAAGNYTGVTIGDSISTGMEYVPGSFSIITNTTGSTVTLSDSTAPSLVWTVADFVSPGGQGEVVIQYATRPQDVPGNDYTIPTQLPNTGYTDFSIYGVNYNHNAFPTTMSRTIDYYIVEPNVSTFSKTSNISGTINGDSTIVFTLRAVNSGTSPAYQITIADTLPYGMRNATPTINTVEIRPDAGSTRDLVVLGVIDTTYTAATGILTFKTQGDSTQGGLAPLDTLFIQYTVDVDDTISANGIATAGQTLVTLSNYADITGYTSMPDTSANERTYDPNLLQSISFQTPNVTLSRSFTRQQSTTYDGGSNRPHITIGEYTTITYEITVPAYTQAYNPNALIQLDDGWEIQEITINGGDNPNIFNYIRTGTYRGFEVQWDRIRAGASDSLVTITVIASVMSNYHGGGSGQNEAGPLNGVVDVSDELRVRTQNRGVNDFNWDTYDENGNPTTQDEDYGPNIRYYVIEPQIISFTKTHTTPDDTVQANENIPFTLTFDNNYPGYNFDSPAYDVVVVDTLPIGMRLTDPSGTVAITSSTDGAFTSGTDFNASFNSGTGVLTIAFDTTATAVVDPNEVITITYTATVDSSIGAGVTMQNCAAVLSYTSIKDTAQYGNFTGPADSAYVTPERVYTQVGPDCNTFYTRGPTSSKSVTTQYHAPADGDSVQIGEEIYYQIQFIVPDSATAYDVVFRDTIPDGLTVLNTSTTHGTITETPQGNGTTLVQVSGAEFDSLFGGAAGLTVTIDITARVDSTFNGGSPVDSTDSFSNTGYFTWNYINDDVGTQLSSVTNTVTTYVNEPEFANFVKTQTTGNPVSGTQIVNYTVTFDNVGDGVAYETVFRDTVPQGMRDTDPTTLSISITVGARTLGAGDTTLLYDGTVFTIEFDSTANTPVYPGETVTINYQLQVDASIGTSAYMVNHAVVDTFSSLPGSTPFERVYQSTQNDTALAFTDGLPTQIKNQYSVFVDPSPTDSTDVVTTIGDTLYYIIEFDVPNQTTAYQSVFLDTLPDGVSLVDLRFQNNSGSIDTLYTGLGDTIALSLGSLPGNATVNPYRITMRTNVDQQYFGGSPDVARDSVLTNRAGFRWNTINGNPASVTQIQSNPVQATIIEPTISNLVKNLDVPPVAPNLGTDGNGNPIVRPGVSSVNYTVTFQNTGNSAAYDVVIRDTIPAEMNGTEPTITTFTSGGRALTDGVDYSRSYTAATGEWIITLITNASNATARVDTAETVLLEYTATLNSEIMESSKLITNRVDVIDYSTLPGNLPLERDTDSTPAYADVGPDSAGVVAIEGATITKTPTGTTWRIGDRQSYTLTVELPRQTVIYYPVVVDTLPEATRMDTTTVSYGRSDASITDPNTALTSFDISDSLNSFRRFIPRWEFNPITNANTSPESIYVYYTVDVTGKNSTGQNLFLNTSVDGTVTNNASVNWNYVNHGFSDDLAADYESRYASTSHTIVQPRMSITKTADKQTVAAGDTVRYRIEVVNSGSSPAKAYDIIITDVVPNGMRSDNPLTGSPAPAYEINNVATTPSLAVYDSTTGRITWTFGSGDSLNSGGDSLVIYYSAIVDSNILDIVPLGTAFTNTAQVDTWYSHPTSTYRRKYSPGPDASATVHLGGIIILPDQSRTVPKGTRVHYFHDVTNLGSVPDDVNLSFTSSRGWAWAIYLDDGSGNPTGSPITSLSNVPAGGTVDIIVTAFVPTSTPDNAVDVTVFTATSVNNPAITSSVTDMTTVGDVQTGSMQLVKSVDKAVASPGDTLLYTVTYINAGADTLLQIDLSDPISEFVNIVYDGFDTGAGSQDIEFVRPDGSTIYLTADANDGDNDGGGYDGHSISIDFTNVNVNVLELTPGQSGQMSYKVTIK
ncbi:MAG: isopeptide-forming domain-containing fimbrial protein, partial [Gemmatimonadetes bacterium]